jgi:excisionase family DNA binding protein
MRGKTIGKGNAMVVAGTDLDTTLKYRPRPITSRTADVTNWDGLKLLLAQEVSEILKIPVASVYDLARRRLIPSVRVGRLVRFEEEILRAWIATGGASLEDPEEATVSGAPNPTQILARSR